MNADKITKLIERENENREEAALEQARRIIKQISDNQARIAVLNKDNDELRGELKALEHEPLNPVQILG